MVVRIEGSGADVSWMAQNHRETFPLPERSASLEDSRRVEILRFAIPNVAEKYIRAAKALEFQGKVLFAEANDKALRLFLKTGCRDASEIHRWFSDLSREVYNRASSLGPVHRQKLNEQLVMHGRERSVEDLLVSIDRLRAQFPGDLFLTSPGLDVLYGVDVLRVSGCSWDQASGTLYIDLVAYQAKSKLSTAAERAKIANEYGKYFADFQREARADIGKLTEVAHVPEADLSALTIDDLLEIVVQGQAHLQTLEQGSVTIPLTHLQQFARRVRWVNRANKIAAFVGSSQMIAPVAQIRSVEGRFIGRDERGDWMDRSFEEIQKDVLSVGPKDQVPVPAQKKTSVF